MDKSIFETLNGINVTGKTEKKNNLTYLSWAWAWAEVKKKYPTANYRVFENDMGWHYHTDGRTCWVKVGVSVVSPDDEIVEYLAIMDYKNNSIPLEKVTSVDVTRSIQRAVTKACARHGLGLYIYAGEDLPEEEKEIQKKASTSKRNTSAAKSNAPVTQDAQPIPFDISATQPVSMLAPNQCTICHQVITPHPTDPKYTVEYIIQGSTAKYGAPICLACLAKKAKEASKNA